MKMSMRSLLLTLLLSVNIASCVSKSFQPDSSPEATLLREERSPASNPTSGDLVSLTLEQDLKVIGTSDGQKFAESLLSNLQGVWKTDCIEKNGHWFQRSFELQANRYSTSTTRFSDNECKSSLGGYTNTDIGIRAAVKTYNGFRFNLSWLQAKFLKSDGSSAGQPKEYPWFVGALTSSGDLYIFPSSVEFFPCKQTYDYGGMKWCNKLRKVVGQ